VDGTTRCSSTGALAGMTAGTGTAPVGSVGMSAEVETRTHDGPLQLPY